MMQMDWDLVIERNRESLLRIVATLFAMAGIAEDVVLDTGPKASTRSSVPATIPRHRHNAVQRILRAAETALRRLVVIVAHRLAVIRPPVGVFMYGLDPHRKTGRRPAAGTAGNDDGPARIPPFCLADPVKTFSFHPPRRRPKAFPRISVLGNEPRPIPDGWFLLPHDEIDAGPLWRRLASLRRALDDLDGQARRLVRWQARRDRAGVGEARRSPMRVGRPPGHRKRQPHEVDAILLDLHRLAYHALTPDTS